MRSNGDRALCAEGMVLSAYVRCVHIRSGQNPVDKQRCRHSVQQNGSERTAEYLENCHRRKSCGMTAAVDTVFMQLLWFRNAAKLFKVFFPLML